MLAETEFLRRIPELVMLPQMLAKATLVLVSLSAHGACDDFFVALVLATRDSVFRLVTLETLRAVVGVQVVWTFRHFQPDGLFVGVRVEQRQLLMVGRAKRQFRVRVHRE